MPPQFYVMSAEIGLTYGPKVLEKLKPKVKRFKMNFAISMNFFDHPVYDETRELISSLLDKYRKKKRSTECS